MEKRTARFFHKVPFLKPFGTTLMETLIVVTLIALLASAFLASANYLSQINKGKDAKRKSDLAILKTKLEDYYNDHNRYPLLSEMDECKVALAPYLNFIPCDPDGSTYLYETDPDETDPEGGQWYRIYARLKYTKDPVIVSLGCSIGCGPDGSYNYGISSNIGLETVVGRCTGSVSYTCGNPGAYCGIQGTCCPGANYVLTCGDDGDYWCCPI